jgi:hypothetical protein
VTFRHEDAPQRDFSLRDINDTFRYVVKRGASETSCRTTFLLPRPCASRRGGGLPAGVFGEIAHDLRMMDKRETHPTAAILDSRTLQSTLESSGHDDA